MAAASKSVVSDPNSTDTWPKWQVALAIGAPLAVVIGGLWVYRRSKRKGAKSSPKKQDGKDNNASQPRTGKDKSSTPSPTKPVSVPEEEPSPLEKAQAEKNKGNKYFKATRYDQAITCYTQAIRLCPPGNTADLATFYHNRAAAYEKLRNNKMVVEDCTTALELNNRYVKALTRRATACEQLEDLSQALEDVTALCILEGFQNPASLQTADRVLKNLGQSKAKEAFRNRKPAMPSKHFIRTYFAAFVNDPVLNAAKKTTAPKSVEEDQVTNGETDTSPYQQALWKITAEEYDDIISLCTQELDLPDSQSQTEARLLRATLYLLCNQYDLALADLKVVLSEEDIPKRLRVNAMIKRGSIYIQMEKQTEGLDDFASAVRIDPENADIYHHRGHHNIQLERIDDALRDLENAISKDPTFAASHVQKSFAEHKRTAMQMMGSNLPLPQAVLQSYKANVDMFPTNGDARALYAQALGDAGKFEEAEMQFSEAVRLDPDNATALVHRGLLKLQADKDIKEATNTINSALELDNRCEYAYEVLGTLEVQQGHMDKAMGHFQKAIEYSRTESEMAHLFSLLEAAKAQLNVAKNFGIQLPSLGGAPMV